MTTCEFSLHSYIFLELIFFLMMVFRSAMWKRSECRFFNISIYYCIQREECRVCVCVCACVCACVLQRGFSFSLPSQPLICSLLINAMPMSSLHSTTQHRANLQPVKIENRREIWIWGAGADRINGCPEAESAFLIRLRVREHVHSF